MKRLIILALLLMMCGERANEQPAQPTKSWDMQLVAGSKWVDGIEVSVSVNGDLVMQGALPHTAQVSAGDSLLVEFEVRVSNFGVNHPQCNCIQIEYAYYDCAEPWIVEPGDTLWEVGL